MKTWKRIAPLLLLGPVSGPLVAAIAVNFRNGRPFLGSLYVILLLQFIFLLPALAVHMGVRLN